MPKKLQLSLKWERYGDEFKDWLVRLDQDEFVECDQCGCDLTGKTCYMSEQITAVNPPLDNDFYCQNCYSKEGKTHAD